MTAILNIFKQTNDAVIYESGEVIFCEGSQGHEFYVVLEGEVDIVHNAQVILSAGPGELFGEMALIDSSPRSADAIARTRCKLAVVNERRFLYLVQETPYFALTVMKIMSNRMRILRDQVNNPGQVI